MDRVGVDVKRMSLISQLNSNQSWMLSCLLGRSEDAVRSVADEAQRGRGDPKGGGGGARQVSRGQGADGHMPRSASVQLIHIMATLLASDW